MIITSQKEFEDRIRDNGGCYYVGTGGWNVMYTLRIQERVWIPDNIHGGVRGSYISDRYCRTLAQDYEETIEKIKSLDYTVYIPPTLGKKLSKRRKPRKKDEKEFELTNIFQYGKYKGQTVDEVYEIDKDYLIWWAVGKDDRSVFIETYVLPLVMNDIHEKALKDNKIFDDKLRSTHQGEIKEKIERTVTIVYITGFETNYNGVDVWTSIYKMKDDEDNIYIWMTSSGFNEAKEIGDKIKIKGTVKAHEEYEGEKQTKLIRVKELN